MTTRIVPLGTNGFIPSFNRQTMSFLVLNESEMLLRQLAHSMEGLARMEVIVPEEGQVYEL